MEILNPMNLKVCYLPLIVQSDNILSSLSNLKTIVVGSLDSEIINTITDLFQPSKNNKLNVISMTSKSAEIYRLAYSSYIHTKINFANFLGELMLNFGTSDETKLFIDIDHTRISAALINTTEEINGLKYELKT